MKKKILLATDTFFPKCDGITRFIQEVIPKLAEFYDITIIAPSYKKKFKKEKFKGMDVHRFPVSRISIENYAAGKPSFRKIKKIIKGMDLVWTNSIAPIGIFSILIAKRSKKPIISYTHSIEWEQLAHALLRSKRIKKITIKTVQLLGKYLYNKCDLLLVPSASVGEKLRDYGINTRKAVIHLGIDTEKFCPENKKDSKIKAGIDSKRIVIGYCGRISKEKNLITLYNAFLNLYKRDKRFFLLIIGNGNKEEIRATLPRESYKITGFVNNVAPYLNAMDIFVMPSMTETSSLATMEAMSCGLPVISTPVGYIKDYIKSGYNGYFFPREHVYILTKKIEKLAYDQRLMYVFGKNARKSVLGYRWSLTISKIKKVIDDILKS